MKFDYVEFGNIININKQNKIKSLLKLINFHI